MSIKFTPDGYLVDIRPQGRQGNGSASASRPSPRPSSSSDG